MDIIERGKIAWNSEESIQKREELWESLKSALAGDKTAYIKMVQGLVGYPLTARMALFYDNFEKFLAGMEYDEHELLLFQVFLEDGEKRVENSKRILKIIDEMDSDFKVQVLINHTQSVSNGFITSREYFKLCKLLESMIIEDLKYLQNHIQRGIVDGDEYTEELVHNGLMYASQNGKYAYSKLAFEFDKYGLSYRSARYDYTGGEDFMPSDFPVRQEVITSESVDAVNVLVSNE